MIKNHKGNCQCVGCKAVRGEFNGVNNPRFNDGRTNKTFRCKICNKEITYQSACYGNGTCNVCNNLGRKRPYASERLKKLWKTKKWLKEVVPKLNHKWTEESKRKLLVTLDKREITGIEKQIIGIITKFGLPFRYCGNGSLKIGGFCPDFVSSKNKKLLIEVFYEYFKDKQYGNINRYMKQRYAIFKTYGYETMFIPYNLLKYSSEEEIANRILKFAKGGR